MKPWALLVLLALPGCQLHPLYGSSGGGESARSILSSVEVAPMEGQTGWLLTNALRDRLRSEGSPRYRLDVKIDQQIKGFGVRSNDAVVRETTSLRARYQLVDLETGKTVLDATAGSDTGVDVVSSEYATIAAEQTAIENLSGIVADQIVTSIARYARTAGAQPAKP